MWAVFQTASAASTTPIPFISAIFWSISGILSGVLGKVPYFDLGGRYGLSVSVKILSIESAEIVLFAFLLPDQVLVPPTEKYIPVFSSSVAIYVE